MILSEGDASPTPLPSSVHADAKLLAELRPEPATVSTRLERARAHFVTGEFSRADYAQLFPSISAPTASRDLRAGVDQELLVRQGDKATARYSFAKEPSRRR